MRSTKAIGASVVLALVWVRVATADERPPSSTYLPPGVAAQINLGNAGLLKPYFDDGMYGIAWENLGNSRATIGQAQGSGVTTGYKDNMNDVIGSLKTLKALPDGRSYLSVGLTGGGSYAEPNLVAGNGPFGNVFAQYLTFPDQDSMVAVGLFAERNYMDLGNAWTDHSGYGLRFDAIRKFSEHWGIYGRLMYSVGRTGTAFDVAPGMQNSIKQGDNRLYTQANLVGTYTTKDIGFLPDGWAFHPMVGAFFLNSQVATATDSFGTLRSGVLGPRDNYGMVFGELYFERLTVPEEWAPKFGFGITHEYVNNLNIYVSESNFAVATVGVSRLSKSGMRLDLLYSRNQGFNGYRTNNSFVTAVSVTF